MVSKRFCNLKNILGKGFDNKTDMQNYRTPYSVMICMIVMAAYLFTGTACTNGNAETANSPSGYDLSKPFMIKLPPMLDEISGLSYYAKDKSVFAIVDETGVLYKIPLNENPAIEKWEFDKKADYEDLVRIDSTFYTLVSKGRIAVFSFKGKNPTPPQEFKLDLAGKNEFEILYHDEERKKLIMICKDCEADKKSFTTAYAFDPKTSTFENSVFTIQIAPIAKALNEEKIKFKPSAAAIHPITHELYIVSSVNKCLVIADTNGVVKQVMRLDPQLFKQPEGICFTPEGHMIISNESANSGAATILIYKYKNSGK